MAGDKPTYSELEQRVRALEDEAKKRKRALDRIEKLYTGTLQSKNAAHKFIDAIRATVNMPELYLDQDWNIVGYSSQFLSITKKVTDFAEKRISLREFLKKGDFDRIRHYLEQVKALESLPYDKGDRWRLRYKGPQADEKIGKDWVVKKQCRENNWQLKETGGTLKIIHSAHIRDEKDCFLMSATEYGGADEDIKVLYRVKTSRNPDHIRGLSLVISGSSGRSGMFPALVGYTICTGSNYNSQASFQRLIAIVNVFPEKLDPGTEYLVTVERTGGRITRRLQNLDTGGETPAVKMIDAQAIYDRQNHIGFHTFSGAMEISGVEIYTRKSRFPIDQFKIPFNIDVRIRDRRLQGRIFKLRMGKAPDGISTDLLNTLLFEDITRRRRAREERLANLRFLGNMEKTDRIICKATNHEQMMRSVLKKMLSMLGCDRAWLLYPCDPEAPSWRVPIECARRGYPGAMATGTEIPMKADVQQVLRSALDSDSPVRYDPQSGSPMPSSVSEQFGVKSQMTMAIKPRVGKPWLFGIHQCSHARVWDKEDQRLFREIGHRLEDGLSSLLFLRDLRESEARLRQIIDLVPHYICAKNLKSKFILVNKKLADFYNTTVEEMTGTLHADACKSQEELEGMLAADREVIEGGVPKLIPEETMEAPDGTIIWIETIKIPFTTFDEPAVVMCATDITERKQLETERAKAGKLESIGILAGGIAHDFNNILTVVLGNISLASAITEPESRIRELLTEAEKAGLSAKNLTQQLLTFSRGGAPVRKIANLSSLIRDSAGFCLRGSNVKCEFKIAYDLWPAEVDGGQISQVIGNLVINADQAMPGGGKIGIRAENVLVSRKDGLPLPEGRYLKISIEDHGTGIAGENLPRIFDPYFTTKQKGSGLGLATAYSIINRHEGHISVESDPGSGATFRIFLPASAETVTVRPKIAKETGTRWVRKILVMDDESSVREVAGSMLKHLGHEVALAADGAEAVRVYKKALDSGSPFDAVILDLTVPGGMGGAETLKHLLEIDPGVIAIVSSGYSNDPVLADYRKHGFKGNVPKPYNLEKMQTVLDKVIYSD